MFHLFYLFYLQVFSNGFGSSLDDGGLQLDGVLQRRAGASDWRSSCRRSSPGEGSLSRRRVLSERQASEPAAAAPAAQPHSGAAVQPDPCHSQDSGRALGFTQGESAFSRRGRRTFNL